MKKSENNKESTSSSSSSCPESIPSAGCGSTDISSSSSAVAAGYAPINLNITTTTGGNFSVLVDLQNSVENLKKIIAKKLKVAKDRICLLHRERELQDGNLRENGLVDGSKIILIPNVETGLLAQRPENTVMQALESLNDAQVNDFLSGKTPLNLSMRLGDHMMLIQLQLSTVSPSSPPHTRSRPRSRSGRSSSSSFNSTSCTSTNYTATANSEFQSQPQQQLHQQQQQQHHQPHNYTNGNRKSDTSAEHKNSNGVSTSLQSNSASHYPDAIPTSSSSTIINSSIPDGELESFLNRHGFESIDDIVKNFSFPEQQQLSSKTSCGDIRQQTTAIVNNCCSTAPATTATQITNSAAAINYSTAMDQSPIKSLSNLVSNPLKSIPGKNIQTATVNNSSSSSSSHMEDLSSVSHIERASMCSDPISAKLTSCLCKRLDGTATASNNTTTTNIIGRECDTNQCQSRQEPFQTETVPTPMITDCSSTAHQQMITNGIPINTLNSSKSYSAHSSSLSSSSSLLHKTVNNPIGKSKHRYHSSACNVLKKNLVTFDRKHNNTVSKDFLLSSSSSSSSSTSASSSLNCVNGSNNEIVLDEVTRPPITATDARALAEASRNLTQTLRKLSKEVFTNKVDLSDQTPRKSNSGAVIESMKNHGKGIYSGTFSGTLNPALQDQYGRPKRDISTVIHILNDLLSATPQYNRDTRINFESSSSSTTLASFSSGRGSNRQSARHNFSTTEQECKKCINNSSKSTNTSCAYGECNGHASFSSSALLNASNSSTVATGAVSDGHHFTIPFNNCQDSVSTASSLNVSGTNDSTLSDMKTLIDERNLCCMCNGSYRNLSEIGNNDTSSSGSSSSNGVTVITNNTTNATTSMKMCNKCSIDLENSKTKCKLDQIRLVMQQRKQKREARKLKSTPYGGGRILGTAQHNNSSSTSSNSNDSNGDGGNNTGNSNDIANGGSNGNGNMNTTVIANNGSGQPAVGSNNASNNNSNNTTNNSSNSNANGTATSSPAAAAAAAAPATSAATTANTITSIAPPSEVSPNHIVEEVDTAA